MENNKLTFNEAKVLPIGTVFVFAGTENKKENKQVHCIVTETGLNYFQYNWYKNKYSFDPASHGVGIPIAIYNDNTTEFIKVDIPPIDVNFREPIKVMSN